MALDGVDSLLVAIRDLTVSKEGLGARKELLLQGFSPYSHNPAIELLLQRHLHRGMSTM